MCFLSDKQAEGRATESSEANAILSEESAARNAAISDLQQEYDQRVSDFEQLQMDFEAAKVAASRQTEQNENDLAILKDANIELTASAEKGQAEISRLQTVVERTQAELAQRSVSNDHIRQLEAKVESLQSMHTVTLQQMQLLESALRDREISEEQRRLRAQTAEDRLYRLEEGSTAQLDAVEASRERIEALEAKQILLLSDIDRLEVENRRKDAEIERLCEAQRRPPIPDPEVDRLKQVLSKVRLDLTAAESKLHSACTRGRASHMTA